MPPLDISWNPYETFKYEKCFNTFKSLLNDYENYYIEKLKYISFSYIQISITSALVSTRLFFDDTIDIGEISIFPIESDEILNNKFSIKDRKIIYSYFAKLNLELDYIKEKIDKNIIKYNDNEEIEESVIQIIEQVTIEYRKINLESHPMDRFFQTDSELFDNIFSELIFPKHAPVSIFQKKKPLTIFEKCIKKFYDIELPVPFTGEVQIAFDADEEIEAEDFIDGEEIIVVKNAKTISEILIKTLKNVDEFSWVDSFQYIGNGKLRIYISQYENDFIRYNETLFNSLINEGYTLMTLRNSAISFEKDDFTIFMDAPYYEPEIFTINYSNNHIDMIPLNEKLVREEILKFLTGFSYWNCIPALFNEKRFDLVAHFDWGWINNDSSSSTSSSNDYYDADCLSAKAVKFLANQRKSLKYNIDANEKAINCLVSEVNKNENYIFSKTYNIDSDNKVENLNELPYGFKGFKFLEIEIYKTESYTNIGGIILWKYKTTKSTVTIEYSIKKTTKELIMNIPFETTKSK
jgi:hypothetical protein